MQEEAERTIAEWEKGLKEQELAEKRRVAPGWLDRVEKILEPERGVVATEATAGAGQDRHTGNIMDRQDNPTLPESSTPAVVDAAGDELDRAFGGMGWKND